MVGHITRCICRTRDPAQFVPSRRARGFVHDLVLGIIVALHHNLGSLSRSIPGASAHHQQDDACRADGRVHQLVSRDLPQLIACGFDHGARANETFDATIWPTTA